MNELSPKGGVVVGAGRLLMLVDSISKLHVSSMDVGCVAHCWHCRGADSLDFSGKFIPSPSHRNHITGCYSN